jgi:hypothetical protein
MMARKRASMNGTTRDWAARSPAITTTAAANPTRVDVNRDLRNRVSLNRRTSR